MRHKIVAAAGAFLAAGALVLAAAGPGPAGLNTPLTVAKVIVGTGNPSATYVVNVTCTGTSAFNVNYNFDSAGSPSPQTQGFLSAGFVGSCTVTETNTGGAVTVTYACALNNPPQVNGTCSGGGSSPVVITFASPGTVAASVGTVTVTNDFTPVPTVPVVNAAPSALTG